ALERVAGSEFSNLQDLQDIFHSAGWVSGGGITDDTDGTITVAAGTGLIRDVDGATETIFFTDWAAEAGANVNLADNAISYIFVEWTGGTPAVFARNALGTDYNTKILLAVIQRTGTTLHINVTEKQVVGDHANSMIRRMKETMAYARVSGAIISATGTRNFALTAGAFWQGLTEFSTAEFDSNPGGDGDTFSYWYRKLNDSGWNEVATQSAIHQTNYDDNSGTLQPLGNNKYGVHWVYLETDDHVEVVYGQGSYTLSQAEDAQAPAGVPEQIAISGILVGKIIIKKSAAAFTQIESAFQIQFSGSLVTSHGDLVDLSADDHTQYLLADGTRALDGDLDFTGPQAITTTSGALTLTPATDVLISDGKGLVVGHTSQITILDRTTELQVLGTLANDASYGAADFSNSDTGGPHIVLAKGAGGTIGTFTAITTGWTLGQIG
ncbi:hypothetical protein LCGC14_2688710, partial [marine sediment metagenome]